MSEETAKPRWYVPTPGRLVLALLVVELTLLLINYQSGWMVLTGIGIFILTILVGLVWFGVALVLRRKFQFSLLSLCGLMLCLCLLGSWFAWKMERAKRQREVAARIESLNGLVVYDYGLDKNGDWLPKGQPPPAWLRDVVGVDFLSSPVGATLQNAPVTDGQLTCLDEWAGQLLLLYLDETQVTDEGVQFLAKFSELKCLALDHTQVTDVGVGYLKRLPKLKLLCLAYTQVSDTGLEHLKGLPHLEEIALSGTHVTDSGLVHLEGLIKLERLYVAETLVTEEGTNRLQQELPNCKIIVE